MLDLLVSLSTVLAAIATILMLRLYLRKERPYRERGFRRKNERVDEPGRKHVSATMAGMKEKILIACAADDLPFGVDLCVFLGANVDALDNNGWGGLHWAAERGSLGSASALLQHGADVDLRGQREITPLISSLSTNYPSARKNALRELLVEAGADVNARSVQMSVLVYAETYVPGAMEMLRAAGAVDRWRASR